MEDRIELVDYISIERLQNLQDSFSALVGSGAAISDANGSAITQSSGMCDFCKYTRVSRIGSERCRKCDSEGAQRAFEEGKPVSYTCHAGLTDFVAPIVIDNQRVGCFVGGQVTFGDLDEEKIMQTAKDIGVNPMMYLAMAKKTPRITPEQLQKAMDFIYNVTLSISDMAYQQYQLEKAKVEVEYAAKLKSDFLANMSHEIRTPMNGVIGIADIALREEMPDSTREYLNQIKSSGKSLLTIINDILDFSKIESGKMDIIPAEYELEMLIKEVSNIIAPKAEEKKLSISVDYDSNIPKVLIGDGIRIKQVITNLVNNAVKFTEKGSVQIKVQLIGKEEKTAKLKLSVIDTGIGITEENLKKLFHSFQQVDSKRNRAVEGTGLGLAISKQLVELMDGEIGVESVYGEGSTFWFSLPQEISEREKITEAVSDEELLSFIAPEVQILIVDDNEVNLTVAEGILAPLKMQIDTASGGKQALEMLSNKKYDLIFMDHMMPEIDGVETTRIIRGEHHDYDEVPIIALTANVVEGSREMFIREGMNDCVTKPVDFKSIAGALYRWLPDEKKVRTDAPTAPSEEPQSTLVIEKLDVQAAIKMLGSEKLFMTVLKDYYKVINSKAEAIKANYDQEDWGNYTILVHALKSSSKQIGAMNLSKIAAELEKAGNARNTELIHKYTEPMLTLYRQYIDILSPLFEEEKSAKDKPPIDSDSFRQLLDSLSVAIDDLDMDGMAESMDQINAYGYDDTITEMLSKLQDSVDLVDVDTAAEIVGEILQII